MERTFFGTVRPLSLEESETVRKEAKASRISPARFLYRDKKHVKRKIDPEGGCNPKATMLCVGGQRDPDWKVRELVVDAPTASRHSVLIGLQVALTQAWLVSIGDIRAAFLNGVEAPQQPYLKQPVSSLVFNQDN